ncbi:hypothetical protein ANCDUO_10749, partial [Ancylostoma duodenale]
NIVTETGMQNLVSFNGAKFFVLSGFLMTKILFKKKMSLNSVGTFYMRRFKRIVPLYMLFAAATYIYGYFCLLVPDRKQIVDDLVWVYTYSSNIQPIFQKLGYWDQIAYGFFLSRVWQFMCGSIAYEFSEGGSDTTAQKTEANGETNAVEAAVLAALIITIVLTVLVHHFVEKLFIESGIMPALICVAACYVFILSTQPKYLSTPPLDTIDRNSSNSSKCLIDGYVEAQLIQLSH